MNQQVTDFYTAALKLMVPLSSEATYVTIVTEAQKLAHAQYGSIFIYKNNILKRVYSSLPEESQLEPRRNGYTYQAFRKKDISIIDIKSIKKVHPELKKTTGIKKIFIPLSYEKYSLGVVSLDSNEEKELTQSELEVLKLFGSLASLKLRTAALMHELRSSIETRDLFISMASHELKTPLTTISAYAQLIERNFKAEKEIKAEWLGTLKMASHRMTRLINELLHVNKIRTGKMVYEFQLVDPASILQRALSDVKLSYPHKRFVFVDKREDSGLRVWGDADKLGQVFINLLSNAAKFTANDQLITAEISHHAKKIVISVIDQGKGIAQKDQEHLFQEFFKAEGNTQEGLGLGLFISKKIINAHKGKIMVASQVGIGTTFTITLPISYDKS